MSTLVNLRTQVGSNLRLIHGGTANTQGWGRGEIVVGRNAEAGDLALGTLVRYRMAATGGRVEPTTATDETTVLGVVVGHFKNDDGVTLIEEAAPTGHPVAVLTRGTYRVNLGSNVTIGQYAFAHATDGTAYGKAAAAAGSFGRFITPGTATAGVYLFGSVVQGAGGGSTFGTPALTLGTANAAGAIDEVIRRDATILAFDATVPVTQAFGDAAAVGAATVAARRDHKHGMPANPLVGAAGAVEIVLISPATGVYVDIEMPFAGIWTGWSVLNDAAGSIVWDVWKDTYANFPPTVADTITAADKPTTATAAKAQGACTGWTTAFAAGVIIRLNVDSTSGLARSVLSLKYTRS